jgi:hypothetical protein
MHIKLWITKLNLESLKFSFSNSFYEHSSFGKDTAYYMQGPGFKPWYTHLFTFKGEILATRLPDQNKNKKTKKKAYNGNMSTIVTKSTYMMKLKCPEYLCLRIFNVEAAQIINWICTWLNQICQSEPNIHRTRRRENTTSH